MSIKQELLDYFYNNYKTFDYNKIRLAERDRIETAPIYFSDYFITHTEKGVFLIDDEDIYWTPVFYTNFIQMKKAGGIVLNDIKDTNPKNISYYIKQKLARG